MTIVRCHAGLKPKRAVESDSTRHLVGAQRDCADSLNHEQKPPASFLSVVRRDARTGLRGGRARPAPAAS
jgi:hypothetical protein